MLSNDETFYILKLYQREKLVDQSKVFCRKYFRRFENAVACISDADIFKHLPEGLRANKPWKSANLLRFQRQWFCR